MQRFVVLIFMMILFITTAGYSQMRMDPAERTKHLKEQLSLSDEQADKVKQILTDAQSQAQSKMENEQIDRGERREAIRSIMDNAHKEIEKILTDEQKEKFIKIQHERRRDREHK